MQNTNRIIATKKKEIEAETKNKHKHTRARKQQNNIPDPPILVVIYGAHEKLPYKSKWEKRLMKYIKQKNK